VRRCKKYYVLRSTVIQDEVAQTQQHTATSCSKGVWTCFSVGPKADWVTGVTAEPHHGRSSPS